MNIFYLDHDVTLCAQYHVDRHCVKMILEYAQLLSTAHRTLDAELPPELDSLLYKATHANHPSAVWTRQSVENYTWLADLLDALCLEYTHRYGRVHKVESSGLLTTLHSLVPRHIGTAGWSEPTPAMPEECQVVADSIASYRRYYATAKQHLWAWKGRAEPTWLLGA